MGERNKHNNEFFLYLFTTNKYFYGYYLHTSTYNTYKHINILQDDRGRTFFRVTVWKIFLRNFQELSLSYIIILQIYSMQTMYCVCEKVHYFFI